jgi:hypothetical protein
MKVLLDSSSTEKRRQFCVMVEDEEGMFFVDKEKKYPRYSYLSDKDSLDPIKFIAIDEENVYSHLRDINWIKRELNIDINFLIKRFYVVEV